MMPPSGSSAGSPAVGEGTAGGLLAVFAHPDDEAFNVSGSMARASAAGYPVALLCATRGEAGEISDPALATPETLGQVRERELRAACAAVGVRDVAFLDYADGRLPEVDPVVAVGRIVAHIRRLRPAIVVTFAANGVYGHVDHIAIHHLTLAAATVAADPDRYPEQRAAGLEPHRVAKVYYTAPARERLMVVRQAMRERGVDFTPGGDAATIPIERMGTPEEEITTRVTLSDAELDAKLRALAAHATQIPSGGPFGTTSREELREVVGSETFVLAPPPISARAFPTPEDDLFAGV